MQPTRLQRRNSTKTNLWFDLAIFVAALLAPAVFLTGLTIHEWLGIGLGVAIIVHLLLHWQWLVQVTKRFFTRLPRSSRINYVLNSLFFIDMTLIVFSGLMISRVVLPLFGIELAHGGIWQQLHIFASSFMVFILALHVALHWKWILNAVQRYILQPVFWPQRRLAVPSTPATLNKEGAL